MRLDLALGFGLVLALASPALVVQAQTIDELWEQAVAARRAGNIDEAIRLWQEILRQEPDNSFAYNNLGVAFDDQGNLEEAIDNYRRAIDLDPDYAVAHNNLGEALEEWADTREVPLECQELILGPADPADPCEMFFNRSWDARGEAIDAFRRATELNPDFVAAHYNLGSALSMRAPRRGDEQLMDEVMKAFSRVIELDPNHAEAHRGLGDILYAKASSFGREVQDPNQLAEAIAYFEKAITLSDENSEFDYSRLGRAYHLLGNLDLAIQNYRLALAIDPDYSYVLNNLAEAERERALQTTPEPSLQEDLAWLPQNDPQLPVMRSVVRVVVAVSGGFNVGTGWVVQRQGNRLWVVTNRHVVMDENADRPGSTIEVAFFSNPPAGRVHLRRTAELVQVSPQLDLALLLVEAAPSDIEALPMSRNTPFRGMSVKVVGHPTPGMPWTLASGAISNFSPEILQISAALAPGNSGGPVLNEQNEVLGIIYETTSPDQPGMTAGFGFAYPLSYLEEVLTTWGIELRQ